MPSVSRFTVHSFTTFLLFALLANLPGPSLGAAVGCSNDQPFDSSLSANLPGSSNGAATECSDVSSIALELVSRQNDPAAPSLTLDPKLTNGERLARGMPLLPPARRSDSIPHRPKVSNTPQTPYHGVLQVRTPDGAVLGYVQTDPNYWTPMLTPDINSAQRVDFSLDASSTSQSQLDFQQLDQAYPFLGLVVGRDSTSSDIAPGSFNYLYFDGVLDSTGAGSTPQSVDSFFSVSTGLDKQAETAVWSVDIVTGAVAVQWINTDSSTPTTFIFIQSNHVYAGGDPAAFNSRFPAPVVVVQLWFVPTVD